ncbi:MerR family transcriptional regulator [Novosphingobium sp.]|uniref:MerR family transcriptional regulator n=1 Tax=Novosphingobium sp. TaxID=1874826 RepID=UPI0038BD77B9
MPDTDDTALPLDDEHGNNGALQGIQDVATLLGVTHRTLRFYEDKGLIEPARVGNTRVYRRREVARMQLILRGKRLGFSIREIKAFLDLYDADPTQLGQMQHLLTQIRLRLPQLEKQRAALEQTIDELRAMEKQASDQVALLKRQRKGG